MNKIGLGIATMIVIAMIAAPTFGANPHFVHDVTFSDLGTVLQITGSVAGLGNENIDVIANVNGVASTICTNYGGNVAPGQDSIISVTAKQSSIEVKNGRAFFNFMTETPILQDSVCPNELWAPSVVDVRFTSATITVIQPTGSDQIEVQETFYP